MNSDEINEKIQKINAFSVSCLEDHAIRDHTNFITLITSSST